VKTAMNPGTSVFFFFIMPGMAHDQSEV